MEKLFSTLGMVLGMVLVTGACVAYMQLSSGYDAEAVCATKSAPEKAQCENLVRFATSGAGY